MPRYRKRPALVDAEQFLPEVRDRAWPEGVMRLAPPIPAVNKEPPWTHLLDAHPHTWFLRAGDYVLTDAQGVRSTCSREKFEAEWEPAPDREG